MISLLLISDENNSHYVLIKDLNSALYNQISTNINSNSEINIFERCLTYSTTKLAFEKHKYLCNDISTSLIIMPTEKDKILKFRDYKYLIRLPFIMCVDIECKNVLI